MIFFSPSELPKNLLEKLSQKLKIDNIAVDRGDELTFFTDGGVKVTFLYYPFPSNFKLVETESGLLLFPVKQIALQKAYTIGRRGEYRDYFDLYTILKTGQVTLDELIIAAKQVYNSVFDEKLFLEQLVYFADISNFEIIPVSHEPSPSSEEVQQYSEKLVSTYIK